jgi:hypothetical protein
MITRIAIYYNSDGVLFYRPQWKLPLLPIWWRFTGTDCYGWWIEEFELLSEAEKFLSVKRFKAREKKLSRRTFLRAIQPKETQ